MLELLVACPNIVRPFRKMAETVLQLIQKINTAAIGHSSLRREEVSPPRIDLERMGSWRGLGLDVSSSPTLVIPTQCWRKSRGSQTEVATFASSNSGKSTLPRP